MLTHILSSLLTKKQDMNMKQKNENQQDTDKHLHDKLSVGAVGCIYYTQTLLIIKKSKI
jgi:hypothetical protein